ncbi:MAG: 1-acyl-sn-glycerol-3-phosphate acyltransferase [Bacteroidales bacterium]
MSQDKYKDIRPYMGEEESAALSRIAAHPILKDISSFLFPGKSSEDLKNLIASLKSVSEFQSKVMLYAIKKIVNDTSKELTYSGLGTISVPKQRLLVSNHRDIMLDSAIIQAILHINDLPTSEMAVGDNLVTDPFMEDVARSNKMIKVIRSGNSRDIYKSSLLLSEYIRESITSSNSSVWIAQRNGRTKDGLDLTEQGLLKMLDMSGSGVFAEDFDKLSITPVSISYEYEPCDFLKARELYISKRTKYKKSPGEDLNSILTGIMQFKGNIHIHFCNPITRAELEHCSTLDKNEKFKKLAEIIDERIYQSYRIWKTNMMAYDIINSSNKYFGEYTQEELNDFKQYCELKIAGFDGDKDEIMEIFLSIYSNPVIRAVSK